MMCASGKTQNCMDIIQVAQNLEQMLDIRMHIGSIVRTAEKR